MQTILDTIHGSHLYGLARPESDIDTYRVILSGDDRYARQTKVGDDDRMVLSLDHFTEQVANGVPQALEALWSPEATIAPMWRPFLSRLRPSIIQTQMRYRRTILSFGFERGGRTGAARQRVDARKMRRHALRLTLNLAEFSRRGAFDPRLTADLAQWVTSAADSPEFDSILRRELDSALWAGRS